MRRTAAIAEYLGLSDQQKAQWRALFSKQREQMEPVRAEARELRLKLKAALDAQPQDAAAVGDAVLAMKAQREKARAERAAFEQQLRAVLTPEQQQKLDAMKAARRAFGHGRGDRVSRPGMRGSRGGGVPQSPVPPVEG
jgi:Spy/CpxP family protein refolding chaperone